MVELLGVIMLELIVLRATGVACVITVLSRHVQMDQWEGCLLGCGVMIILGTLYDRG